VKDVVDHISLETSVHATESKERVYEALGHLGIPQERWTEHRAMGHHGNAIVILNAHVERAEEIQSFLESPFIISLADVIADTLPERVDDKGHVYIRADKQDLLQGIYSLQDRGDVRMVLKIISYPQKRHKVIRYATHLLRGGHEGD
jgi:RNA binding exosome subunit